MTESQPKTFQNPKASKFCRPLTISLWLYGFDLKVRSNKRFKIILMIFRFLLRLPIFWFLYVSIKASIGCAKVQGRSFVKPACQPILFRSVAADQIFGLFAFLLLICKERQLAQFFDHLIDEAYDALPTIPNMKRICRRLSVFSGLFVFFIITLTIGSCLGMVNVSSVFLFAFTSMRSKIESTKNMLREFPIRTLSTLVCGLYAASCCLVKHYLCHMTKLTPIYQSLEDYRADLAKIYKLVKAINNVFDHYLPFLYVIRVATIFFWVDHYWEAKSLFSFDLRLVTLFFHLFQCFCLLVPPIVVNNKVQIFM